MRFILLGVLMLAVPANAATVKHHSPVAAAGSLPPFTFMNHGPGVFESPPRDAKGNSCEADKNSVPDEVSCTEFSPSMGGVDIGFINFRYYKGRLYNIFGHGPDGVYAEILGALSTKYGVPTIWSKPWESKGGAKLTNTIATWKFRDGKLELDRIGLDSDSFSFKFDSIANHPPAAVSKVDF